MSNAPATARKTRTNALIYVIGAIGGSLFGYDTAVISGALLFINKDFHLTPLFSGVVTSAILAGAIVGAAVAGPVSDRLGRKRLLLADAVIFTIGALGAAFSPGLTALIVFRFVLGLSVGSASFIVPLYLVELAPTRIRGPVATLNTLAFDVGALAAYAIDAGLASSGAWRWMLGLGAVPSVIMLVGTFVLPETPRWLVRRGRDDEARSVLGLNRTTAEVEPEVHNIKEVLRIESGSARELLAPWVRPALIVGVGLAILQQITGINSIIYYAPTILTTVGFGDTGAVITSLSVGVVGILSALLAIKIIDRVGRKFLLLGGSAIMIASLAALSAVSLLLPTPTQIGPVSIVVLVCLLAFDFCFAATWGPAVWILLGEIFPLRMRGVAAGVASTALWAADLLVTLVFPPLLAAIGIGYVYLIFLAITVGAMFFIHFLVTETKGRSLEDIEADLMQRGGIAPKKLAESR
jgi:sugar porter (SP) family MFS transporter